jgi:CheY-like chemotaxis protein
MIHERMGVYHQACEGFPAYTFITAGKACVENGDTGAKSPVLAIDHFITQERFSPEKIWNNENSRFRYQVIEDPFDAHENNYTVPRFSGEQVLLAEDNPTNMLLAIRLLEKTGLDVIAVNNGHEALEVIYNEKSISCVILDIHMPVMDGITTCRSLRESGNDTVPVLALTAYATDEVREQCSQVGFDAFISKPIKVRQLYGILEKIF